MHRWTRPLLQLATRARTVSTYNATADATAITTTISDHPRTDLRILSSVHISERSARAIRHGVQSWLRPRKHDALVLESCAQRLVAKEKRGEFTAKWLRGGLRERYVQGLGTGDGKGASMGVDIPDALTAAHQGGVDTIVGADVLLSAQRVWRMRAVSMGTIFQSGREYQKYSDEQKTLLNALSRKHGVKAVRKALNMHMQRESLFFREQALADVEYEQAHFDAMEQARLDGAPLPVWDKVLGRGTDSSILLQRDLPNGIGSALLAFDLDARNTYMAVRIFDVLEQQGEAAAQEPTSGKNPRPRVLAVLGARHVPNVAHLIHQFIVGETDIAAARAQVEAMDQVRPNVSDRIKAAYYFNYCAKKVPKFHHDVLLNLMERTFGNVKADDK